jgi:hypothetical protein
MSDHTYQELNINEIRAVQLTIEDRNGIEFAPSASYVTIKDIQGNIKVPKQMAFSSGNKISTIVGTRTTSAAGNYNIIWEIKKSGYTYYHCTELEVSPLCLMGE